MKQSKTNITHLSRINKATSTSDLRPSRSLSSLQNWKAVPIFTWGITSCFIITPYLYRIQAFHYRTHYNQWCCLHWMGHDKSPTVNCCRVLYITYWHKFLIIFNSHFVLSGVDTVPSFVPNKFSSFVFYLPFLSFCHRSAQLIPIMCTERSLLWSPDHDLYCWLASSLFWYSARLSFLKRLKKNTYPTIT